MANGRIVICGDLVPTAGNYHLFEMADLDSLLGTRLQEYLEGADFCMANLETPLTDVLMPIPKSGKSLNAPTGTANGIRAMGIHLVGLANNHILDHGMQGLQSTWRCLDENGIAYVGAGSDLSEARKTYFFDWKGKRIGVYACAEQEFTIATDAKGGANPFDPLETLDQISAEKAICDYLIVLYHGGVEHYRYPSPQLQKTCRKLVDKGADLVLCQHSHCVGCEEKYKAGTIIYGQGNFLFDGPAHEYRMNGLLVQLDQDLEITYIPIVKRKNGVRLAEGTEEKEIRMQFLTRSQEIRQPGFVEQQYRDMVQHSMQGYILNFSGIKRFWLFRILNRLSGNKLSGYWMSRWYRKQEALAVRNQLSCEAHRELIIEGLKIYTEERV